jgi:hypothetical protein
MLKDISYSGVELPFETPISIWLSGLTDAELEL